MSNQNVFSTDDEYLRVTNEKWLLSARKIFKICIACIVIASVLLSLKIALLLIDELSGNYEGRKLIGLCVFILITTIFILIGYFVAKAIYSRMLLKAYGLFKGVELWVINYERRMVCMARPFMVHCDENKFDTTEFVCIIEVNGEKDEKGKEITGEYVMIEGSDIYFTKDSAEGVLKIIEDVNSQAIEQYYPDWKQDRDFVDYYKEWQDNHIREKYSSLVKMLVTSVIINNAEYVPSFTFFNDDTVIEAMIKGFIDIKKETEHKAKKTQQIINQMSEIIKKENLR